jgi:hypothetical protein
MPQIQGGRGAAVLGYRKPRPTQEMRHHTAFPKGKNWSMFYPFLNFTQGGIWYESGYYFNNLILLLIN